MAVKLQAASATDLPAYNFATGPVGVTQVMLIANPMAVCRRISCGPPRVRPYAYRLPRVTIRSRAHMSSSSSAAQQPVRLRYRVLYKRGVTAMTDQGEVSAFPVV